MFVGLLSKKGAAATPKKAARGSKEERERKPAEKDKEKEKAKKGKERETPSLECSFKKNP